jgi:nucleotide-binding universal stress UspA family protein
MSINPPTLVGVDGSAGSDDAVRWAAVDAVLRNSPLHLVYAVAEPVIYGPALGLTQFDHDIFRQDGYTAVAAATKIATEAAAPLGSLDISTFVVVAPPIPVLGERSEDARMLVVGTRGLDAFRRGLLGSVSTALARHGHCPIAVIPETDDDSPDRSDGPIVLGVDGSACSTLAIEIAFDEASRRKADLVAVHAWTDYGRYFSQAQIQEEGTELLSLSLAGYGEEFPDVHVRRVVVGDRPAKQLLEASENAQMVIVGSHGRGGFAGMTLGSTSQAVLHGAECPVVIARPQR